MEAVKDNVLKISKELLRAVLPKETESLSNEFSFYIDDDYIVFCDNGEQLFDYCIYKFAFKCKEWAFNNRYFIKTFIQIQETKHNESNKTLHIYWTCHILRQVIVNERGLGIFKNFEYEKDKCITELEIIFKACEWILTQKDKKC